jgi:ubiquitin-protein ligase
MPNYALFGKPMFRRIVKEIEDLYAWYDDIQLIYNPEKRSHTVHITDRRNKMRYELDLGKSYPFQPPQKILVNGVIYKPSLKLTCPRFIPYLQILSKHSEFSWFSKQQHRSTLCKINWGPAIRLLKILDEIEHFVELKKTLVLMMLTDSIKEKYCVPEDIPLIEFLI